MTESIPYDLKYFMQDIGIIEVLQVVEKVETEYARFEGGRFVYKLHRSPMCEYMINFILKLKHLPETYMKNSVLENFTILQVGPFRDLC